MSETRVTWQLSKTLPAIREAKPGFNAQSEVVLLAVAEGLRTGYYDAGGDFGYAGWCLTDDDGSLVEPTHWAVLPEPPVLSKPLPDAVGLWWVMAKLFNKEFRGNGEAYDFMKKAMQEGDRMMEPFMGGEQQPRVSPGWLLGLLAGSRFFERGAAAKYIFGAYLAGTF
jgi:hypothetical protein